MWLHAEELQEILPVERLGAIRAPGVEEAPSIEMLF
jgi:hypothetical protein